MQKSVSLQPGESKQVTFTVTPQVVGVHAVSVDGLSGSFTALPPPSLQLVEARFDDGQPMTKKPGDTFRVTLKIKNNLNKEWSPSNIMFGFGYKTNNDIAAVPLVWGQNPFTGEVDPQLCGLYGFWPLGTWPVIPAGATKTFTTTYGLCPGATEGVYDGCILMEADGSAQRILMPGILTVVWPTPRLTLQGARLYDARWGPREYGGYAIFGKVDVTLRNDEGRTLTGQSPDYVDLQIRILRASDRGQCGFVRFSRDIPPGTNGLTLDRTERGWGVSEVSLSPGALNYIIEVKIVLLGWPGNPYVYAEFTGTVTLG